jgi:galactokinase
MFGAGFGGAAVSRSDTRGLNASVTAITNEYRRRCMCIRSTFYRLRIFSGTRSPVEKMAAWNPLSA